MTKIVYEPKGKAYEYSPLAANLYRGCTHSCRYCYAPDALRINREEFGQTGTPRKDILKALQKDAIELSSIGNKKPILLCFSCDPYQPAEREAGITRESIEILGRAGQPMRVLTKAGLLAQRDLALFEKYKVEVGVTLLFWDEEKRNEWEPGTTPCGTRDDRVALLSQCHERGIKTWVSVEPVIEAAEALQVIGALCSMGLVDKWKIGKLNHNAEVEARVNWPEFLKDTLELLTEWQARYYIKDDLWKQASTSTAEKYLKSNLEE